MTELFLICALSLPAAHHTRPPIVSWQVAKNEVDRLRDFIHKNNPDAEIVIDSNPPEDILKRNGYERVPFTWRGNQIWIHRKPATDGPKKRAIEVSA